MNRKHTTLTLAVLLAAGIMLSMTGIAGASDIHTAYWTDAVTGKRITDLKLSSGQDRVIRLNAEIPADKTLKAYSLKMGFDPETVSLVGVTASPKSEFPPMNINVQTPGTVLVNSFHVVGVKGSEGNRTISLIDVQLTAKSAGESSLSVMFSAFGASAADDFKPSVNALKIITE